MFGVHRSEQLEKEYLVLVCRVLTFSERHLKKVDAVKIPQRIFDNEILVFISTIICLAHNIKIGGKKVWFYVKL